MSCSDLPNIEETLFHVPTAEAVFRRPFSSHRPRILLLYGSVRQRSFSRLLTQEAARLLEAMGAETRIFNPSGLPLPDDTGADHPKVAELRELVSWSEGMVWSSPESPNRLDSAVDRLGSANPGQNSGGDAGQRWLAVI